MRVGIENKWILRIKTPGVDPCFLFPSSIQILSKYRKYANKEEKEEIEGEDYLGVSVFAAVVRRGKG